MIKKQVIEMDYNELEDLIRRTYGHNLEVPCDLEAGNDSAHTFNFKVEPWIVGNVLHDYGIKKLEKFKATGEGEYLTCILMQDMVNNGVLEPGDYLINICW